MQNIPSAGLLVLIPGSYLTALGAAAIADFDAIRQRVRSPRVQLAPAPLADPVNAPETSPPSGSRPGFWGRLGRRKARVLKLALFLTALGGVFVGFAALGAAPVESGCGGGVPANAITSR